MSLGGILNYTGRAARFALILSATWAALRILWLWRKGERPDWRREARSLAFVFYAAALTEIIALRGGPGDRRELQWTPFSTILGSLSTGPWAFIYHMMGNAIWFVPLGMFLWRKGPLRAAITGAAISTILETLQWLLKTGVTDIDDILINALGALIGWLMMYLLSKHPKHSH